MEVFIEALRNNDIEMLKKVPKADLHNHANLGMRYTSLINSFGRDVKSPPVKYNGLAGMFEYLAGVVTPLTSSNKDFEQLIHLSLQDAIDDGVSYIEMSIDIRFMKYYANGYDAFFKFIEDVSREYSDRIEFRPEIGANKTHNFGEAWGLIESCIESGLFGSIDIYGPEDENSMGMFKGIYRKAGEKRMLKKAHVGEFSSAESIKRAVVELELDEVQHGISAYKSSGVIEFLRDNNIVLHICPASNVCLGAIQSLKEYPIRRLFDSGVKFTINTDDLLLFNRSLSEQYLDIYNEGLLKAEELDIVRRQGLKRKSVQL